MKQDKSLIGAAIVFGLLVAVLTSPVHASDGKAVYLKKCSSCHGKDGKGNSKMAQMFKIKPEGLDVTKKSTLKKSDEELIAFTEKGAGKMKGFKGKLEAEEIAAVVTFLRTLAKDEKESAESAEGGEAKAASAGAMELYNKKCSSCHGTDGKGKEKMATMFKIDASALDMLSEATQGKSDDELVAAIETGKGKMKGFKGKLTSEEIADLVAYIRSLK